MEREGCGSCYAFDFLANESLGLMLGCVMILSLNAAKQNNTALYILIATTLVSPGSVILIHLGLTTP